MGLVSSQEDTRELSLFLFLFLLCEDTAEVDHVQARKSSEPNHACTLILNFQPSELWEINACCLSSLPPPVYGIVFYQPQQTKTLEAQGKGMLMGFWEWAGGMQMPVSMALSAEGLCASTTSRTGWLVWWCPMASVLSHPLRLQWPMGGVAKMAGVEGGSAWPPHQGWSSSHLCWMPAAVHTCGHKDEDCTLLPAKEEIKG